MKTYLTKERGISFSLKMWMEILISSSLLAARKANAGEERSSKHNNQIII